MIAGIVLGVIVVVGLIVGLWLVPSRKRKNAPLPKQDASPYPADAEPAAGASATGGSATATLERPDAGVLPGEEGTEEAGAGIDVAPEPAAPTLETPEGIGSRLQRLRARLARSGGFGKALLSILSRGDLSEDDWEELEETLLLADVGVGPTTELIDKLRTEAKILGTSDAGEIREVLRRELLQFVGPDVDRSLNLAPHAGEDGEPHPATVLVVGVNGTGKTTTIGKLARVLVAEDHDVLLGAADTFRAAAAEQLGTWGERVGVPVVRSEKEGADPASVAFDAVSTGRSEGVDVVVVDTAGRLQNKAGLMEELGKIKRVMSRQAPVSEVLLVLDATTGQNGMQQAKVFSEAVDVTGIVLTKLDGTAKGGIVVAVQRELGVPVKFIGLGEGPDDLAPFVPEDFVDSLLA
ncbi:Signal recognition particle receptor protein FtsY (=alpha subunit) (TC 3.A.5.1.1) [Actinomycetales bacterium JB111]|nr:Signal recognition particle receptor protein FtsY (=alpha subunit) (TC 3.A.5.1.1) [Actinomycetales bacterium JB111]